MGDRTLAQAWFAFHLRDGLTAGLSWRYGFQLEFAGICLAVFAHDGIPLLR